MNLVLADELARQIADKNSLQHCNVNDLQRLAETYPYFSAAQLLLAFKQREDNDPAYEQQLKKLCLYFQHPLWLEQLLEQKGDMIIHPGQKQEILIREAEPVVVAEQPAAAPANEVEVTRENTPDIKTEPMKTDVTELTFEPYHTVDYFASQGIRFKEETQPADKFGQQLKSFTEWLKTLKRLPVQELATAVDRPAEQKVEQLAEKSLADREVLTEAMAEVWGKQGNKEKAIETYRKLSLLDPSKSSYFAAKIEQLKQS